jgi:hypothetical protein
MGHDSRMVCLLFDILRSLLDSEVSSILDYPPLTHNPAVNYPTALAIGQSHVVKTQPSLRQVLEYGEMVKAEQ